MRLRPLLVLTRAAGESLSRNGGVFHHRGLCTTSRVARLFEELDVDHSGDLTERELLPVYKALAGATEGAKGSSELTHAQAREIIRAGDTDGNGTLDRAEFTEALQTVLEEGAPAVDPSTLLRAAWKLAEGAVAQARATLDARPLDASDSDAVAELWTDAFTSKEPMCSHLGVPSSVFAPFAHEFVAHAASQGHSLVVSSRSTGQLVSFMICEDLCLFRY